MQRTDAIKRIERTIQNINDKGLEIITGAIVGLEDIEKYNINTTKERLEQIKAEEKQETVERKAQKEAEERNNPDPYTLNETMKMLGHQCSFNMIGSKGFKEIDNILKARPCTATIETAMDVFVLGYIYGKRAERAKRKGNPVMG